GVRLLPLEHLVPAGEPMELPRLLGPKGFRIVLGAAPEGLVLGQTLDRGPLGKFRRRREYPRFLEDAGDFGSGRRGPRKGPWLAGICSLFPPPFRGGLRKLLVFYVTFGIASARVAALTSRKEIVRITTPDAGLHERPMIPVGERKNVTYFKRFKMELDL